MHCIAYHRTPSKQHLKQMASGSGEDKEMDGECVSDGWCGLVCVCVLEKCDYAFIFLWVYDTFPCGLLLTVYTHWTMNAK